MSDSKSFFHFGKFLDRVRSNNKNQRSKSQPELRNRSLMFHLGAYIHADHPDLNIILSTFDDNNHLLEQLVTKDELTMLSNSLIEECKDLAKDSRSRNLKPPPRYGLSSLKEDYEIKDTLEPSTMAYATNTEQEDSTIAPLFEVRVPRAPQNLLDAPSCVSDAPSELTGTTRGTTATSSKTIYKPTGEYIEGREMVLVHYADMFRPYGGSKQIGCKPGMITRTCIQVGSRFRMKYENTRENPRIFRVLCCTQPVSEHNHGRFDLCRIPPAATLACNQQQTGGRLLPTQSVQTSATTMTSVSMRAYAGFDPGKTLPTAGLPKGLRNWL
jgi:hypothetical protein